MAIMPKIVWIYLVGALGGDDEQIIVIAWPLGSSTRNYYYFPQEKWTLFRNINKVNAKHWKSKENVRRTASEQKYRMTGGSWRRIIENYNNKSGIEIGTMYFGWSEPTNVSLRTSALAASSVVRTEWNWCKSATEMATKPANNSQFRFNGRRHIWSRSHWIHWTVSSLPTLHSSQFPAGAQILLAHTEFTPHESSVNTDPEYRSLNRK